VSNDTYAAIDIGTNTLRLLIAQVDFNSLENVYSLKEICSERIITRLGDGITRDGFISDRSMRKSLDALEHFSRIVSDKKVTKTSVIATSALREARNSEDFITKAKKSPGFDVRIISGKEEAKTTAKGMMLGMDIPEEAIQIDIGGGSSEIIYSKNGEPELMQSLDLGVVYLSSRYMKSDPPSAAMIEEMETEITGVINSETTAFDNLIQNSTRLIGTAGTITTLAAVAQDLESFDHDRIHKSRMSATKVSSIFSRIAYISSGERSEFIPFERERLDIIVPGTLILLKIMERFSFDEITVSDYGLREGIILDLYHGMEQDGMR
jgi:exopolyphosphatase/guanosine-5'-triphosphate,3'-diphosphate pyrophosphatase